MTVDELGTRLKEMKFPKIDDFMVDVDLDQPLVDEHAKLKYKLGTN